jgi:hypothetical protein
MPEIEVEFFNCKPGPNVAPNRARYFRDGHRVTVRVKLVPTFPLAEGDDLSDLKALFRKAIRDRWNVDIPCALEQKPLEFDIEYVDSNEHYEVKVGGRGKFQPHKLHWRSEPYEHLPNSLKDMAAHEFGHMLGLPDDYPVDMRFPCDAHTVANVNSVMGFGPAPVTTALLEIVCGQILVPNPPSAPVDDDDDIPDPDFPDIEESSDSRLGDESVIEPGDDSSRLADDESDDEEGVEFISLARFEMRGCLGVDFFLLFEEGGLLAPGGTFFHRFQLIDHLVGFEVTIDTPDDSEFEVKRSEAEQKHSKLLRELNLGPDTSPAEGSVVDGAMFISKEVTNKGTRMSISGGGFDSADFEL